jgi:hypothetical protein
LYDFQTQKFFNLTDEDMNYFITKNVAFFNNTYYFVSWNDGNIYELNANYGTYDYGNGNVEEIPRVRTCSPIRQGNSDYFCVNNLVFTCEEGQDKYANETDLTNPDFNNYIPRIDMSISKNGAQSFSSYTTKLMNRTGVRKNRVMFRRLGIANDLTIQFRFWSKSRIVVSNGEVFVNP